MTETTFTADELLDEIKPCHTLLRKLANQPGPCECPFCAPIQPEDKELLDEIRAADPAIDQTDLLERAALRIQELLERR